jgi:hypothetical protein
MADLLAGFHAAMEEHGSRIKTQPKDSSCGNTGDSTWGWGAHLPGA